MIPLSDDRIHDARLPIVTIGLIAINLGVYLLLQPSIPAVPSLEAIPEPIRAFYDRWALVPAEISRGVDLYSLISSMFLHGSLGHLAGNMLYLWIFGDNVEHVLGHRRYLAFYLLCGVLAALLQILVFPSAETWTLGASGAIAGVLGAYLVLFPDSMVRVLLVFFWIHVTRVRATVLIALWFALQLWSGTGQMAMSGVEEGGVAYWAHVGGFAAGFLLIRLLRPREAAVPPPRRLAPPRA